MFKNYPHFSMYIYISLFSLFLTASCTPKKHTSDNLCVQNNDCLTIQNEQVRIIFNKKHIFAEESTGFKITSTKPIANLKLVGVNMDMGYVPVLIKPIPNSQNINLYEGQLFLGICSEPVMNWQLKVKHTDNSLSLINMTSYWSKQYIDHSL